MASTNQPAIPTAGHPTPSGESLHRVDDAAARFGVSRSTWWRWVQEGYAPKPLRPSPGVTVWRSSDLDAFMAKIIEGEG